MTDIGLLGAFYGFNSFAGGINNSGQIVGMKSYPGFSAFLYSGGIITDLGALGAVWAHGINDSRQVVGQNSSRHAYLYSGGSMTDIGDLGAGTSEAYGINDSGQVVGIITSLDFQFIHAFLYSGGNMTDLGTFSDFPGGYSWANAG